MTGLILAISGLTCVLVAVLLQLAALTKSFDRQMDKLNHNLYGIGQNWHTCEQLKRVGDLLSRIANQSVILKERT